MGDSNGETVIRTKGVTLNNVLTFLTAIGLGGGGLAAYKHWPDPAPIVQAVDNAAREAVESLKTETVTNRTKTWEAINALRESQSKTDTQIQVLTGTVANLANNVQDYVDTDRAEANRREIKMDKQDDRIRELEIRRTP